LFSFGWIPSHFKVDLDDLTDAQSDTSDRILDGNLVPGAFNYLESPDELMEENFEEALGGAMDGQPLDEQRLDELLPQLSAPTTGCASSAGSELTAEDLQTFARHGLIEMAGDDMFGRKIITIYACRLPAANAIDHQKLLK
jgi:Rho GTPase-activating protein 1